MKRKGAIILSVVLLLCVVVFMGFRGMVHAIRDQRTCDWANIDNIELHAHIDVPRVTTWDCDYDKTRNIKRASFTIDLKNFNAAQYIEWYHLSRVTPGFIPNGDTFLHLDAKAINGTDLYAKEQVDKGERSHVLFQQSTGKLWVTIEYKD